MKMSSSKPQLVTDEAKPIISGINGGRVTILGHIDTYFVPDVVQKPSLSVRLYVVAEQNPLYECIVGMDFITTHIGRIMINPPGFTLTGKTDLHKFEVRRTNAPQKRIYQVSADRKVKLNPNSEVTFKGRINDPHGLSHNPSLLFTGIPIPFNSHAITAQSSLSTPDKSMCIPITMV